MFNVQKTDGQPTKCTMIDFFSLSALNIPHSYLDEWHTTEVQSIGMKMTSRRLILGLS